MHIIFGSRGSKLALAQTNEVMNTLKKAFPMHSYSIKIIETTGDRIKERSLDKIGDKGVFVKEIEQQLLGGQIHVGVHSMKDMPSEITEGLCFAKTWVGEDVRDVLLLKHAKTFADLPAGAVIATGSKRRAFQLLKLRPDVKIIGIRGNIDTRIQKLKEGTFDGMILAAAGLHRLQLQDEITQYFSIDEMVPACAQGKLALQVKDDNVELLEMLNSFSDTDSELSTKMERAFLAHVKGGCHIPVGACVTFEADEVRMKAILGKEDGSALHVVERRASRRKAMEVAIQCADYLMKEVNGNG